MRRRSWGSPSSREIPPLHNAWAIGWTSFFTDAASAMIMVLMPLYLLNVLGETPTTLGIILGIGTFLSFALRFVSGWLSDRSGQARALAASGYTISAVVKPVLALAQDWVGVGLLRVADRLGKALRAAPRDVLVGERAGALAPRAFAIHKAMDIAGEATGLVVIMLAFSLVALPEDQLIRSLMLGTAIPGVLAIIIAWIWIREVPLVARASSDRRAMRISPQVMALAGLGLVSVEMPLIVGRLGQLDVSMTWIATAVFAGHLGALGTTRAFGRATWTPMTSKIGARIAAVLLTATTALLIKDQAGALCIALITGQAGQTLAILVARTQLSGSDDGRRGSRYGAFYLVQAIALATGAVLSSLIWTHYGFATMGIALLAAAMLVSLPFLRAARQAA